MFENNLLYLKNPLLFQQIDFTKHADINLKTLTCWSKQKIWWKCKSGHEWESSLHNRSKGRNCPYCSNRRTHLNNCIAIKFSNICKEWNYDKNLNLTPFNISWRSNKKIWWICKKKHEYQCTPYKRSIGRNCPYCSGKKINLENCLSTKQPELCKEWNYSKNVNLTPYDVTQFSTKKVWWKCKNNHEWESLISNRSNGAGCKRCNNPNISKIELKFFKLFKNIFINVENSYTVHYENKKIEIDIFIKDLNLGIEYDGVYYHKKEKIIQRDLNKNNILKNLNIDLIRIREKGLSKIQDIEFIYNYNKREDFKVLTTNILNYIKSNYKLNDQNIQNINNFLLIN